MARVTLYNSIAGDKYAALDDLLRKEEADALSLEMLNSSFVRDTELWRFSSVTKKRAPEVMDRWCISVYEQGSSENYFVYTRKQWEARKVQ